MRDVFKEYRMGLISWDEAYFIANNNAATIIPETEYWASQMESLGIDASEKLMNLLGYKQDKDGIYKQIAKHSNVSTIPNDLTQG